MANIFLVENSDDLREAAVEYLIRDGHYVTEFRSADEFLSREGSDDPELFVLDVMLPGRSGISLAHAIRSRSDTPIIFVSTREDEMTKTAAFAAGGDDYMVKPYSPRELALRVAAILRRISSCGDGSASDSTVLRFEVDGRTTVVDYSARWVMIDDVAIALTRTEWEIFTALIQSSGAVVTREQIMHRVFDYDTGVESRALDTHIKNLRRKIGPGSWIETVHGRGFRFGAVRSD